MFADYSNQERTVQEKGVNREVRTLLRGSIPSVFAVNYCCGNGKAFADRERIRIGGRKAVRVCRRRKKEGGKRERRKT